MKRSLALVGAVAVLTAIPLAAQAAPLDATYDASGTSHIAKTNSDVQIKPTTLTMTADSVTAELVGHMPIPDTSTEFNVIGFLPVKATVSFVEAAPVTGKLLRGAVQTTASYYIKLSNVKVLGFPTFAGPYCQTKDPVSIPANTPPGATFNILTGGPLHGEFTIGNFEHCGLNTWLINALVPGAGNTVDLNVSNGVLG